MKKITYLLKRLERENNVKILFAIESGSRSWGFPSKDSDFDVRCIHLSKPDDYIGIFPIKDQIEIKKDNIDIVSWDIKKFTRLLTKSNPTVSEWLSSKIIYIDNNYRSKFKKIFEKSYNRSRLKHHYLSLVRENYSKYIKDKSSVNLKKYVYILRGLGCKTWLNKSRKLPPLDWKESKIFLPKKVQEFFKKIVILKQNSEDTKSKSNKEINNFIEQQLNIKIKEEKDTFDLKKLNKLLIEIIKKQR